MRQDIAHTVMREPEARRALALAGIQQVFRGNDLVEPRRGVEYQHRHIVRGG